MLTRFESHKVLQHPERCQGVDRDSGSVFHRNIVTNLVPHIFRLHNVGLPCSCTATNEFHPIQGGSEHEEKQSEAGQGEKETEGGRGRDDPIAGGEEAGDGGANGVDLADALVPSDGGGEGRPDGVDALDAVDVGGVDGCG